MQQLLAAAMITIRIYNYVAAPPDQIDAARAAADRIFQGTGISLQWMECRVPGATAGAVCAEPLRDGEFVLRLLESSNPHTSKHVALGSSLLDIDAHGGVLMTIDPRRIATVAGQAGVEPALVLGRAMAHELGHMLLGTSEHARAGLMRALWSQRELQGNNPEDWQFSPREVSAMRHGLAVRSRAAN